MEAAGRAAGVRGPHLERLPGHLPALGLARAVDHGQEVIDRSRDGVRDDTAERAHRFRRGRRLAEGRGLGRGQPRAEGVDQRADGLAPQIRRTA